MSDVCSARTLRYMRNIHMFTDDNLRQGVTKIRKPAKTSVVIYHPYGSDSYSEVCLLNRLLLPKFPCSAAQGNTPHLQNISPVSFFQASPDILFHKEYGNTPLSDFL